MAKSSVKLKDTAITHTKYSVRFWSKKPHWIWCITFCRQWTITDYSVTNTIIIRCTKLIWCMTQMGTVILKQHQVWLLSVHPSILESTPTHLRCVRRLSRCCPLCPCSPQAPGAPAGWSPGCCCCVIGLKLDAAVHWRRAWSLTARSSESSSHLGLCACSLSGCSILW